MGYVPSVPRFSVPYAYFGDPQSLNLYSYVGNNPLKRADPDGHCPADNPNCGKVNVTVDQPTPEMKVNVAGPNGATSGPGVQTTIKITDNGKSVGSLKSRISSCFLNSDQKSGKHAASCLNLCLISLGRQETKASAPASGRKRRVLELETGLRNATIWAVRGNG